MFISFETTSDLQEVLDRLKDIELMNIEIKLDKLSNKPIRKSTIVDNTNVDDRVLDVFTIASLYGISFSTVYKVLNQPGCPAFTQGGKGGQRNRKKYIRKSDFDKFYSFYMNKRR